MKTNSANKQTINKTGRLVYPQTSCQLMGVLFKAHNCLGWSYKEMVKKRFAYWLFLLAFYWLALARGALTANAQTITKTTAIPPRLEITVGKGKVEQAVLRVRNNGSSETTLRATVEDFIVSDEKGTPLPVKEKTSGRWAASTWVQVSPTKFTLKPGETKQLDLIVAAPADAFPGGHYAVVFYQPVLAGDKNKTASFTSPNVGSLLYITIPGKVKENAFVSQMEAPKFSEYGPIKIKTKIENLSDIHIKPMGTIKVYDWFGRLNATIKLKEKNIFPGSARVYENRWPVKWGFGRYQARLEAGYGSHGQAVGATIFFWVLPYRLIAIAGLGLLIAVLLLVYFRMKNRRADNSQPEKDSEPYSED